jgi:eukaryotic-like serine/threonine-protein kinase
VTQVGEGQETTADEAGPVMTFGAPTVGEILAERYQLEEHVNNDSAGRQVWRGVDVILRRPVAVVLRYPGGESATEMLQAAVAASRVIHPNLCGVYDAIDEGQRAYVVREWVDGEALRDLVAANGPLDPPRATAIAHSIADALAAVHATGMVHGNVHPGTTLIGDDGRVVLADARADSADSVEGDVRAVGGLLYYALTGTWPHDELGQSALPDPDRDASGALPAPRAIRPGVPAYLDDLTMDLLDKRVAAPEADALAAELDRLDSADDDYEDVGPLRFAQATTATEPVRNNRKIVVGVGALVVIALIGLIFGIRAISNSGKPNPSQTNQAGAAPAGQNGDQQGQGTQPETPAPQKIPLTADMVRIVDPPDGDRVDKGEAKFTVDDDPESGWETQRFNQSNFGNFKKGMGVLIHLKEPHSIADVRVETTTAGASMDVRVGTTDYGDTSEGDKQILEKYKKLGEADSGKSDGTKSIFAVFDPDQKYQYILVFVTDLPKADDGSNKYKLVMNNLELWGY